MNRILVVDDDMGIVDVLKDLLKDEGWEVLAASNGEEGLACIAAARPELALVDVMMPVMDGLEVLRRVNAGEVGPPVPIVLMSAAPKSSVIDAGITGHAAFLRKPFDLMTLLATITRILGPSPRARADAFDQPNH